MAAAVNTAEEVECGVGGGVGSSEEGPAAVVVASVATTVEVAPPPVWAGRVDGPAEEVAVAAAAAGAPLPLALPLDAPAATTATTTGVSSAAQRAGASSTPPVAAASRLVVWVTGADGLLPRPFKMRDVEVGQDVGDLKDAICAATGLAGANGPAFLELLRTDGQTKHAVGEPLNEMSTLTEAGVTDGSMLVLRRVTHEPAAAAAAGGGSGVAVSAPPPAGGALPPPAPAPAPPSAPVPAHRHAENVFAPPAASGAPLHLWPAPPAAAAAAAAAVVAAPVAPAPGAAGVATAVGATLADRFPYPCLADDARVVVVASSPSRPWSARDDLRRIICVHQGDITRLAVDAIVNPASHGLTGGGGVDGAIHRAGGRELTRECRALGTCDTGDAKLTRGYNLPARYVIHTVGPTGGTRSDLLASCYRRALQVAVGAGVRTIAFPCIATGAYGFPEEPAAKVALSTVRTFLDAAEVPPPFTKIVFCCWEASSTRLYRALASVYFPCSPAEDDAGRARGAL